VEALCILLVEDEALIRLLLTEELTEAGFAVCQAASGDEAATIIESATIPFTLLITDIHMPGERDGIAVSRLMRCHDPGVPVVFTSGRPDVLGKFEPLGQNEAIIPKPFLPSEVIRVVRRLLNEKAVNGHE
jgi:DNA-binding response OmpR family regulator